MVLMRNMSLQWRPPDEATLASYQAFDTETDRSLMQQALSESQHVPTLADKPTLAKPDDAVPQAAASEEDYEALLKLLEKQWRGGAPRVEEATPPPPLIPKPQAPAVQRAAAEAVTTSAEAAITSAEAAITSAEPVITSAPPVRRASKAPAKPPKAPRKPSAVPLAPAKAQHREKQPAVPPAAKPAPPAPQPPPPLIATKPLPPKPTITRATPSRDPQPRPNRMSDMQTMAPPDDTSLMGQLIRSNPPPRTARCFLASAANMLLVPANKEGAFDATLDAF